ncbi:MAG: hypothetical protein WCE23_03405 [Candidatus Binatus sp.]|uniref:hypothetical protein n=1 Tax=Candidatus Binatus sp. TaxID=2811406 RepID=UPI003C76A0E5
MRALEDAAIEIERALEPAGGTPVRLMTMFKDDIADSVKPIIVGKLEQIRSGIRDLKSYYDLDSDTVSNRRHISTKLAILAIDLTECRAQYLRGYGEVPEEEKALLDDRVSRLEALVNDIDRLLGSDQ